MAKPINLGTTIFIVQRLAKGKSIFNHFHQLCTFERVKVQLNDLGTYPS